ncbi:MAG: V4R domain-containing protein [Anaerolineae bacterium]
MAKNSILSELVFNPTEGGLRFKGVRYLLIRPETIASFQKSLEAEAGRPAAGQILYAGGFTGGQLSGRKYKDTFGLSDREAVEFMCRMGGEIGWGHFRLVELDSGARRLVVEVNHSPFAVAYAAAGVDEQSNIQHPTSKIEGGVCHLIRGVLGGLAAGVFSTAVTARETHCAARGDSTCRFEVEGQP